MPFDGTELPQAKQDLISLKELLIEKGWVPYSGTGELAGPNCILTGFSAIAGHDSGRILSARDLIYRAMKRKGLRSIVAFNDSQTSIEPILELIDRAIGEDREEPVR